MVDAAAPSWGPSAVVAAAVAVCAFVVGYPAAWPSAAADKCAVVFVVEVVVDSAAGTQHIETQFQPIDASEGTQRPGQYRVVRDTLHPDLPEEEDATLLQTPPMDSPFPAVVRTVFGTLKLGKVVDVVAETGTRDFFAATVAIVALVVSLVGGPAVVFALAEEEKLARPPSRLTGP